MRGGGQGREASKLFLQENPKIMEEIAAKVIEHDKPKPPVNKPVEKPTDTAANSESDTAISKDEAAKATPTVAKLPKAAKAVAAAQ